MQYLITFLEGIISFISPCMLPLLPLYITYFAGGTEKKDTEKKNRIFYRAFSFVAGFTLIFSLMGLFAGTIGSLLRSHSLIVNIVTGGVVVVFGLSYLGIIPLNFLKGSKGGRYAGSVVSAFVFGIIYSLSLTPCIGAFLGSALMLASSSGTAAAGVLLLITYSLGLGIPFLVSALLTESLSGFFGTVKKHYRIINLISGLFLIALGVLMMTGLLSRIIGIMS